MMDSNVICIVKCDYIFGLMMLIFFFFEFFSRVFFELIYELYKRIDFIVFYLCNVFNIIYYLVSFG